MDRDVSNYNYIHSFTRIVVEQAFGRLKNRFKIYQRPLNQLKPCQMANIIKATLVLHNWFIDVEDSTNTVYDLS